jgi:hypothetical protein
MKNSKLKIEVFFPFGSCACTYGPLMEKVGRATSKYKNSVEVQMKSTSSKEARQYALQGSCVIVDGVLRFAPDFDEKDLEEAIVKRNKDNRQ